MSYTTRSRNGEIYYQGSKDDAYTVGGRAVVNVRGDHGMTNERPMYHNGQIIGKHGGTRMAGEKMKKFQQGLDNAKASEDTQKVEEMRAKKRDRLQTAREGRYNRRNQ
jgi:hypothetical protein